MRQNTGRPGSELVWEEGPLRRSGAEVLLHLTISCYTTTDLQAREPQRRRPIASGGSGGPPPGFGRAAENFFGRSIFLNEKNEKLAQNCNTRDTHTHTRHTRRTQRNKRNKRIKRPRRNKPKMQKSSRLKLHAGCTENTKRRV